MRDMVNPTTRRSFLSASLTATAALTTLPALGQTETKRYPVIAFSKPFQHLDPDQTAALVADVGWDGIECPVRNRGQVLPEKVEDDLPKFVEALAKRNLKIYSITTDIREPNPVNERVLRTAAKLGIRKYRLGTWKYSKDRPVLAHVEEVKARCKDLEAMNREINIQAGLQNHSGSDYFGAPLWDAHAAVKDCDPRYVAVHFDIGHATLEAGLSWPIQSRLLQPHFGSVYVKDFRWEKANNGAFRSAWCPLGEGMVKKAFFDDLKKTNYEGPIHQHHEYFKDGETVEVMVTWFKKDLAALKKWIA